jgi:large subunit ribosomal protein L2
MGKRIIQQRRGRGTLTYRVPRKGFRPRIEYMDKQGKVTDIRRNPLANSPLAEVIYDDNTKGFVIAPEGVKVGDSVQNFVKSISDVNEGSLVFAIETYPYSGPKLCRSPGSFSILVSKTSKECTIQLPSKRTKGINPRCRVTLGIPAGEGAKEKPLIKAGNKYHRMHARGKLYPKTSGSAMNAYDHPFGGGYTGIGKPKSVARNAPPGRKVGSLSPKRTGKRK